MEVGTSPAAAQKSAVRRTYLVMDAGIRDSWRLPCLDNLCNAKWKGDDVSDVEIPLKVMEILIISNVLIGRMENENKGSPIFVPTERSRVRAKMCD